VSNSPVLMPHKDARFCGDALRPCDDIENKSQKKHDDEEEECLSPCTVHALHILPNILQVTKDRSQRLFNL